MSLLPVRLQFVRNFSISSASRVAKKEYEEDVDRVRLRRIQLFNKRHIKQNKKMIFNKYENCDHFPYVKVHRYGTRHTGNRHYTNFEHVPEMNPEIIVPDLTNFNLKPYVSYRTIEVNQEEFTAQDLFDAVYLEKIEKDFHEGKLDEHGNPLEPSENEKMTPEEARIKARQTGSDIFKGGVQVSDKYKVRWEY